MSDRDEYLDCGCVSPGSLNEPGRHFCGKPNSGSDRRVHLPGVLGGDDSPAEDVRASESIDMLVQLLTSRAGLDADMAERCMFDLRNALDELDRLRRVVAAVAEARSCLGAGPMDYEAFVDVVDAALGAEVVR